MRNGRRPSRCLRGHRTRCCQPSFDAPGATPSARSQSVLVKLQAAKKGADRPDSCYRPVTRRHVSRVPPQHCHLNLVLPDIAVVGSCARIPHSWLVILCAAGRCSHPKAKRDAELQRATTGARRQLFTAS